MTNLAINVRALLSFFDEDKTVSKHSNAIKTMAGEELMFALLIEYFLRDGFDAELLAHPCTTGKSKGPRLDGWVKVKKAGTADVPTFYQVEVKSWSAHGVGGGARFVKPSATPNDLAAYRRDVWAMYWLNGRFIEDGLNKVLTPMKCPVSDAIVKPLACLWSPVNSTGDATPFFSVRPEPSEPFPDVFVFSASSFLRGIEAKEPTLNLHLPQLVERMGYLSSIFVTQ